MSKKTNKVEPEVVMPDEFGVDQLTVTDEMVTPQWAPHDNPPDVSILMPAYNATKTIVKAIRSAVSSAQAGVLTEILVADDGSTDTTLDKANGPATVIKMPQNSGPAACLNRLVSEISGRYVMTLEADDWLEPDSLGYLVSALNDGADFAYGWTTYHGIENHVFRPRAPHHNDYFYQRFESLYCVMFRRECLEKCRWHTFAAGYGMHDYDFVLQLIEAGYQGVAVPQIVLHYDYQPTGLAHQMKPRMEAYRAELRERHPKLVHG